MPHLVVDSSVAVKWFVVEPYSTKALEILNQYREGTISFLAPDLINAEFGTSFGRSTSFKVWLRQTRKV